MRMRSWRDTLLLTMSLAAPPSLAAQALRPASVSASDPRFLGARWSEPSIRGGARITVAGDGAPMARWLRWGLVGAGAGALAFPLLSSMASDQSSSPARAAVAGAAVGFVVIGGGVALWDAVCGGETRSRRAGLCGRR